MMSVTELTIPMRTVTARVFLYGERYAGTWQHGEIDGRRFGAIERAQ